MTGGRLREWLVRLAAMARRGRHDDDLEAELRAHLALAAEAAAQRSDVSPDSSRAAHLRAGGVDQAMAALRDQRGVPLLADLGGDLRDAMRLFRRTPGVALVAIASLAVGLALALTAGRVVSAYLMNGFPYPSPDRLYAVVLNEPGRPQVRGADTLDWTSLTDVFRHQIAWDLDMFYLLGGEFPEAAAGAWVTPGFIEGLGVRVEVGRTLTPADFAPSGPTHVLISHRLWHSRFGGEPSAIGRSFQAYFSDRPDEAATLTVVGVLPSDFWHINPYTEVLAPLRVPALPYLVTLAPDVDPRVAAARIEALVRGSLVDVPDGWQPTLASAHQQYVSAIAPQLGAVAAAVCLVLLIASANAGILLLVRAVGRQHEWSVRLALGASRRRLARLFVVEGLLIALAAAALAWVASEVLLGTWASAIELHLGRRMPGGHGALTADGVVLAVGGGLVLLVTLLLVVVPLAGVSLPSLSTGLVNRTRSETATPVTRRVRAVLVGAEVAGAFALLVGAGLMIDSTRRLIAEDLGIRTDLVARSISLRPSTHPEAGDRSAVFARLLAVARDHAGSSRVALGVYSPLQPPTARAVTGVGTDAVAARVSVHAVTHGYFDTLGIAIVDGRTFDEEDRPGGAPVAIVSERLAHRLWPDGRGVGDELLVTAGVGDDAVSGTRYRVTGVVRDVPHLSNDGPGVTLNRERLDLYVPFFQDPGHFAFLFLPERAAGERTSGDTALRQALARVDAEAAVFDPQSLAATIDGLRRRPRSLAWLLTSLAGSATALAFVGVYGVIAYTVRQRRREIGIRMAIGATRADVVRLVMRDGRHLLAGGLLAGTLAAAALGRVLETQLFGVDPIEPVLLAAAGAALAIGGTLALWWPARRAAVVDPTLALRAD